MATRWAILFGEKVADEIARAQEHLCGGGAPDFASYREQVGYLRGLMEAQQLVRDVDKQIMGD